MEVVIDERFELTGTVAEINALMIARITEIEKQPETTVLSYQAKAWEYVPGTGGHIWRVKIRFSEERTPPSN